MVLSLVKKEEPQTQSSAELTGSTVVKGNISKNIISPNGSGVWINTGKIPAKDISVSIKVNHNSLYPIPQATGADVYTAKTDDNGNYSVIVKTNAKGVTAQVTVDGFTATLDTLINGSLKPGLLSNYTGTTFTTTLVMGQNFTYNYGFTASNSQSNPNNILVGNAIVSGSVGLSLIKEIQTGTLVSLTTAFLPLSNHRVYLTLTKDPYTLATKLYEVNTDGNGRFSFNLETVAQGTSGFTQSALLWISDYAATRDTVKLDNSIVTGRSGVFSLTSIPLSAVYSTEILNANYLQYINFTAD